MLLDDIKNLTTDEILSEDLFKELFYSGCEEVDISRKTVHLSARAKELGILTGFKNLHKMYKKIFDDIMFAMKSEVDLSDGKLYLEDKYPSMNTGIWKCSSYRIWTTGMYGDVIACTHPIAPVEILTNAETGLEKVKIAWKKRDKWKEVVVDKDVIASANKIINLSKYGISVTSESAKNLVRFMSEIEDLNQSRILERVSTSRLGWINGGFMPYMENIIFDAEGRFGDIYKSIKPKGERQKWFEMALEIRKSDKIEPKFYLAAALSSVLVEPLNALPFIVNLWGKTGRGKTVALMYACSVWASPGEDEYISGVKTTVNALEMKLDFLNNMPFMLDDMAHLKNKFNGDFSELVYFLCSGKGKDRSNQNLGINRSSTWKNVILTNAEHSLVTETMQGGAINRIIDVKIDDGSIFENGNKTVECLKENYGFLGKEFLDLIEEIGIHEIANIQKNFLKVINDIAKEKEVEKEEKQTLPMSILLTVDMLITDNIFKDGMYLDINKCVDILKNKGEVCEDERAYEFIMSEVSINMNKFEPDEDNNYKGEVWGAIDNNYVYIIKNIFDKFCERGNFSSKSFCSWMNEKGISQTSDGRISKTKRINGTATRCIWIKREQEKQETIEFEPMSPEQMSVFK